MDKAWTLIIDTFVGLIIMIVSVAIYFSLRTETVIKTLATNITDGIILDAKETGCITADGYERYIYDLSQTGALYDISLKHSYEVIEPEYRIRTLEEVLTAQNAAYTGSNIYHYHDVVTEIPYVSDPVSNGNLNTDTNASIMAMTVNTPASPSHIHKDECYLGTKHTHSGSPTSGGGCYGKAVNGYTPCGSTSFSLVVLYEWKCNVCGYSPAYIQGYVPDSVHSGFGYGNCPGTLSLTGDTEGYLDCNKCGSRYTIYRDGVYYSAPEHCTGSIYVIGYSLNCGKTEGVYYYDNTQVYPSCSQQVISISSTNTVQTVAVGDPLITTVVVTFFDGSTKTVICNTTFSTAVICQNQTATLTYNYMIGTNQYSKTCTITVSVIPRNKTCVNDHTYNLNPDGSDGGCPYCRAWVRNIRVTNPASSTTTITIGTTLQENGVTLLVTYFDGHIETITSGYIDNLDKTYLGTRPVTIGYKGVTVQLMITTVCAKMTCEICGYIYDLYPDGTNPGCPRCIQRTPVFTGNVIKYEEAVYTDEILEELYTNGIYKFKTNDVFSIKIKSKSKTLARNILQKIYPGMSDRWYGVTTNETIGSK